RGPAVKILVQVVVDLFGEIFDSLGEVGQHLGDGFPIGEHLGEDGHTLLHLLVLGLDGLELFLGVGGLAQFLLDGLIGIAHHLVDLLVLLLVGQGLWVFLVQQKSGLGPFRGRSLFQAEHAHIFQLLVIGIPDEIVAMHIVHIAVAVIVLAIVGDF